MAENIQKIKLILQELFERRKEYLPDYIKKIAEEIESIIKKCDLSFIDYSDGLCLHSNP
ncbi:MAG: hypothetical protein GX799_05740 [Crenarchaeota archaeon]|jgi:hypothetical protein|nr:hypothetical protein [Thermoproteota archaeon]